MSILRCQGMADALPLRDILSKHFGAWGKDDPTPTPVAVTFRFALGQRVRWAKQPAHTYQIVWRRYQEGQVSTFVAYGVQWCEQTCGGTIAYLAYEPDLVAVEDAP